ncbi:MAG: DUF4258 domain-containing protein [Planctomycetota bacterium]
MSQTLEKVCSLVTSGYVRISSHGYDELVEDGIMARDLIAGIETAVPVEDYPDYAKGPCVLVLQRNGRGRPVHAVWGIPRGKDAPAVLVTACRPDPGLWSDDFLRRRQ